MCLVFPVRSTIHIVNIVYKGEKPFLTPTLLHSIRITSNTNTFSINTYRLETAIPCIKCSGVAFCSISCRTMALSTYHKFECNYLDLLIGSGMSVLCFAALRIISQQSIEYFADVDLDGDTNLNHPYKKVL